MAARGLSYTLSLSFSVSLSLSLFADPAFAQQPKGPPPGAARSSSQFTLRREEAGGPDATVARSRARAGDCAGALPAFDAAIKNTIEPSLRRDRGLCHEKLGDTYPAIEDYRAYLTARPEANDADQIRERLAHLEEQTGQGGPSAQQVKESNASAGGATRAQADKNYDEYLAQEKLADAAETSPLRNGSGWIIGPFLQIPTKFFFLSGTGTLSDSTGYAVGATFRYATGPIFTLISELGYAGIGTSGAATAAGGVTLFLGGELRFPFSRYASDQIYAGAGVGFQRYVIKDANTGFDFVPLRIRAGYRHVFGPAVALEIGPDLALNVLAIPDGGGGSTQVMKSGTIGGALAFLVAF
jgi:hypothetical protein